MPVQRTLFGVPLAPALPPRRFRLLFVFVLLFFVALYSFGPPSTGKIPAYDQAKEAVKEAVKDPRFPGLSDLPHLSELSDHLPKLPDELASLPALDLFGPPAHTPPEQANSSTSSSYGAITWFSDFRWRNPFSTKITLDENRAVLPPLADRPPIFTYYEPKPKQNKQVTEAENRLILAWRRAWWAQGFKPIVLSHKDAIGNPRCELLQRMKLESSVELEFMRWCAWGHMGGGILANYLALPMAAYDNPMLTFLRRKEYPKLSRVKTLQNGIFFGEAADVNAAVEEAINHELLKDATANKDKIAKLALQDGGILVNLLKHGVTADEQANGIAYYTRDVIDNRYKVVREKLQNTTQVEGLDLLAELINSHLHLTFQEIHFDGIAIVKPLPEHTTALTYGAIEIGRNLTQCPSTPMPKSCPPNRQNCKPCDPNKPLPFRLTPTYENTSSLYSVGTVPHPYTLTTLHYTREDIDANFLVKEAERNMWLFAVTKDILGPSHSELYRVLFFKDEVAALRKASHSLWLTAERTTHTDLEWIFGFNLPQSAVPNAEPTFPSKDSQLVVFPRPGEPAAIKGVKPQEERWIRKEEERLQKAREVLTKRGAKKTGGENDVLKEVEDWNMLDTEAWKFARAFSARRRVEREVWEEEEEKYSGSERKAGVKGGGGRWVDRI